jgi:hypothetical protein
VFSSGAGAVLSAVADWVVSGASWLLSQIGSARTATTSVDLGAGWFESHYKVMAGLAGVVVLPMLLLSVVQAVYRQSPGVLVRSVAVQLPLAALLAGAAVQLVQLALAATDALGATVSAGAGGDVQQALSGVARLLVTEGLAGPQSPPTFVVLLGGLLVAAGAFVLWVELLVRAAAVYVAVLFLPLALASLVWPAVSHWSRRLADTLVALILAKFGIVAVLSLAAVAVASGTQAGFASVLGGGALLLLAAFTPFTLLRLIPAVEAGAVHQLEGARHRARQALGSLPRTAAAYALHASRSSSFVTGEPGTGLVATFGEPGSDPGGEPGGPGPGTAGQPAGGAGGGTAGGGTGGGAPAGGSRGSGGSGGSRGSSARGGGRTGVGDAGGPGGPGGSDSPGAVPMWRGRPLPEATGGGALTDPGFVPWEEGGDPSGRGPLPLWGGPVEIPDDSPPEGHPASRETFVVDWDRMGPVVRWSPPGGSPGASPWGSPGGSDDG